MPSQHNPHRPQIVTVLGTAPPPYRRSGTLDARSPLQHEAAADARNVWINVGDGPTAHDFPVLADFALKVRHVARVTILAARPSGLKHTRRLLTAAWDLQDRASGQGPR